MSSSASPRVTRFQHKPRIILILFLLAKPSLQAEGCSCIDISLTLTMIIVILVMIMMLEIILTQKTTSSVFICFYQFLSVFICFYLFLSVLICLYLFLTAFLSVFMFQCLAKVYSERKILNAPILNLWSQRLNAFVHAGLHAQKL